MIKSLTGAAIVAVMTMFTAPQGAHATAITVNNFSFESPALSAGSWSYGTNPIPGWSLAYANNLNGNTIYDGTDGTQAYTTAQYYSIPNGTQAVYINYNGGDNGIYQDVGALAPDTTYNLTVYAGERLDGLDGAYAGVSLLNGTDYHGAPLAFNYLLPSEMTPGYFTPLSLSYTTGSSVSGDLTIYLDQYLQAPYLNGSSQVSFDNVSLNAISAVTGATNVPVPDTLWLLATGAASSILLARRRLTGNR